jgi:hypothetical protein
VTVSRRTLLSTVAAAAAVPLVSPTRAAAASPPGDVVGKISVGYQGWFACPGDGAPIGGWWHWSANRSQPPSPGNTTIESWPDMREFDHGYTTAYPNLGNGGPAQLFSSYDAQTVNTHFAWMRTYGIDTAALQRFNPVGDEGPTRDAMAVKVRAAAEATGRKFYIMYDVTGWTSMQSEIKNDWTTKMLAHTASSSYAKQNGKPVVCIWGFGFNDAARPFTAAQALDVINWFKAQGAYVIGGVPTWWRQGINDSRPGFLDAYHAFHAISPWMVGRARTLEDLDSYYTNANVGDYADCQAHGIDYLPCVLPGDLQWGDRRHGDYYWRSLYNMIRLGSQGLYVSMFDEFNEGNQIAKTAETAAAVPAGSDIRPLDEDGTACSADYYLRITGDGGRMLKGQIARTSVRPTQPVLGTTPPEANLAAGRPATASSSNGGFVPANATDGNLATYWESAGSAFPAWYEVDLGATYDLSRIVLRLPAGWETRTQTVSVQGGTGSTVCTFNPSSGNSATLTLPALRTRYVRITVTANSGWPAAQLAQIEVYGAAAPPQPPVTDLARGKPTGESSHTQSYASGNAVDGNPDSYWESANNAFPQWLQVDLGTAVAVGRVVLRLPSSWGVRTQTVSVQGSTTGSSFTTLSAAAARSFSPAAGNAVTATFTPAPARYLRVTVTGNTGWPAGQLSTLEAYAS